MTLAGFVVRNACRNKRRLLLTLSSVTVSLFLLTVLQVMLRGLTSPEPSEAAASRIVVRHRVSLANMLPAKYKVRLLELPGVAACSKLLWFGGIYQDEANFFPQFACDPADLFRVMTEARIDPQQLEQFARERTACVVGAKTMQRFGWRLGDRVTLLGAMWPCNPELTIRGVFTGFDETILYFHHDYLDQLLGDKGFTGLFWVRADKPGLVSGLIESIDAEFLNSDAETKTEMEHSFQVGFVSMLGNLKVLIGSISSVIVFTLLLVTASTMIMAVRERTSELALLKTLGYSAPLLFGLILAESFGLAMVGGLLGCGGAWLLLRSFDIYTISRGLFVSFDVTPQILFASLLGAALLGIASCLVPAGAALRRSVADGIRAID